MKYEYCPNGNRWQDITGIFDRRTYMYCDCDKCNGKIYELRPVDVTNKTSKEKMQGIEARFELDAIKRMVCMANMHYVSEFINDLEEAN